MVLREGLLRGKDETQSRHGHAGCSLLEESIGEESDTRGTRGTNHKTLFDNTFLMPLCEFDCMPIHTFSDSVSVRRLTQNDYPRRRYAHELILSYATH